ncbi:aldehyde dehydrogenase, putative [Talaromyces stipitatus ATCC 10500]|uniref:Aldehyde dehydrogenase n=1 Tax=Talaromyces stipitatus (strain ATCC 10500 / CBS 375.48 / QM 6759 / NRRL 1006) TaxID=441959 RepID=B8M9E3_TALSN|nr:aldehyde dehydrogenase, putative [Talaromyces stipitatus ATCC 10500]EED17703.1 aldehyde dehydrogenase, putative [Talaromyces stipitatus ATCC 10500]
MVVTNESIKIHPLEYTPVETIQKKIAVLKDSFYDSKTRPVEFRKLQLRKLYWAIRDNQDRIVEALARDMGRPPYEAQVAEIMWLLGEILFVLKNLDKWLKDEPAPDIPWLYKPLAPKIRKDPMGTVLVIGSCNYPFQLTFSPMIGAIAAGNTVVLKPSEQPTNSAQVAQEIVETALDPSCYTVVQGSITEVQALLAEKWDKILFTGSQTVGRIIAKAAAPHMTPVVLELGGLNPAIVTRNADLRIVARRLLWAKTLNGGQTCTAQNYILVEKSVLPALIEQLKKAYKEFYPSGSSKGPDFTRIINDKAFQRLKSMLDNSKGRIIMGGTVDEKERYIEQTFIEVDSIEDSMVINETFGPICAVLPTNNVDEAISLARKVQDTTLSVSVFGNSADHQKVMAGLRSGSVSLNDAQPHVNTLPFGGVGESGTGAYRGRSSIDVWTHARPYTNTPRWMEYLLDARYPPYTASKLRMIKLSMDGSPDFDREGRQSRFTWLKYILGGTPSRVAAVAINEQFTTVNVGSQAK